MAKQQPNKKSLIVIAYDICDDRRLKRLHKQLKKYGLAVQYSIFEAILTPSEIAGMKKSVDKIIRPKQGDRVRYYALCASCRGRIESTDGVVVREKPAVFV